MTELRACILCGLVKTYDQFMNDGCDNCERKLGLAGASDRILDCTTTNFTGYPKKKICPLLISYLLCRLAGVVRPKKSWVARWQRLVERKPGLYAVKVLARLPEDVADELGLPID